jgi:pimeloyl-ACP methyl ester carboxylesterase
MEYDVHTGPNGADSSRFRARLLSGLAVDEQRMRLAGISTAVLSAGSGPPLVLLHGPGEFAAKWLRVMPDLAKTHRVIAPDLPAHGASDGAEQPLDSGQILAWLGALIERTCAAPPVLIGHVLGGAIAARFAAAHGERISQLVLVDSLGLAPFRPAPRFALAMAHFLVRPGPHSYERFMRQCSADLDRLRTEMADRWEPFAGYSLELARRPDSKAVGRLLRTFGLRSIPSEQLAGIRVPTALIWGRHDLANRLAIAETASARYGWPLHVIDECADDPARDRPDRFLAALRTILARTARAATASEAAAGKRAAPEPTRKEALQ